MDFTFTEDQEAYAGDVRRFAQKELNADLIERDAEGTFSRDAWKRCADFGLQGLPVPEAYGGSEASPLTVMRAMEALGYGCSDNGLIFSLNAQMWAVETPIVHFGTDEQKQRYLPGLCDGSLIGAHAMSEPGSGSDAFALSTTATKTTDGWVLNGTKTFATNAPIADVFLVFATIDKARGFLGLCAFLIDRHTPGLTVGKSLHKMGLRTSPMAEVFIEDCHIPKANILGRAGLGMAVFNSSMEWERGCILASTVGAMQRQLERSVAHARERKQFGESIGHFQAISHKLVEMRLQVETSRLMLYRLGWLMEQGKSAALEAALTKLHLSESYVRTSLDALQIHGGYGYMTEYELEREVRDAIGSRLYSGTSEIQRNIIAGLMGL